MKRIVITLAALVGVAGSGYAQDGGKLPWKESRKNPQAAVAEAKKSGKPMLMFFTSDG